MKPADYLTYYATKFNTVEINLTFHHTPSRGTVYGWAKVPQAITHEKCLGDCREEIAKFIATMELLGEDKLGPLLLQFPHFDKGAFKTGDDFLAKLRPFLKMLPKSHRFALEVQNENWLNEKFADTLREHNIALVLQDQSRMPLPSSMEFDFVTASFTYIRLVGDKDGIEKQTNVWSRVIVNRSKELRSWVDVCQQTVKRGISTYVYVDNHYAGHAPATLGSFVALWNQRV